MRVLSRSLVIHLGLAGSALILTTLFSVSAFGHGKVGNPAASYGRTIDFPDTDEYQTLVMDLHTHSVFSDGHVWPSIRVEEALRDGLDAIAITEHLEYQPHLADIPNPDRNQSYRHAVEAAAVCSFRQLICSFRLDDYAAGDGRRRMIQDNCIADEA
jgi:hypothetical protein